jgi:hypothetical protein
MCRSRRATGSNSLSYTVSHWQAGAPIASWEYCSIPLIGAPARSLNPAWSAVPANNICSFGNEPEALPGRKLEPCRCGCAGRRFKWFHIEDRWRLDPRKLYRTGA